MPDFTLTLNRAPVPNLPALGMRVEQAAQGLRFLRPRGVLEAALDFRRFEVTAPRRERHPCTGRPWLMLALWAHLSHHGGAFLHGALCLLKGRLVLLMGQEQRGKSTLSRLVARHGGRLITDEYPFAARGESGMAVHGSPWPGFANATAGGPPAVICFLRHAPRNELVPLNHGETMRRLIATTRFFSWSPASYEPTLEVLGELAATAPAYDYGFLPDQTAVRALEALL